MSKSELLLKLIKKVKSLRFIRNILGFVIMFSINLILPDKMNILLNMFYILFIYIIIETFLLDPFLKLIIKNFSISEIEKNKKELSQNVIDMFLNFFVLNEYIVKYGTNISRDGYVKLFKENDSTLNSFKEELENEKELKEIFENN